MATTPGSLMRRLTGRDPDEDHRAATPLELLFDLVFVVAIAQAASGLEHAVLEAHFTKAVIGYLITFFAIWWAWVNFTWFASAYDTDGPIYRLATFVQMTGALLIAAGIPRGLAEQDYALMVLGYVVARVALVGLWLVVAKHDPSHRPGARRYAMGLVVAQAAWVAWLAVPEALVLPLFVVLALVEMAIPAWAEHASPTTWHRDHIVERYGLMTIIVLGESILAATVGVQTVLDEGKLPGIVPTIVGGALLVYAMWWLYFDNENHRLLSSLGDAFLWGYTHYVVFAAAAAVGAGIVVVVEVSADHGQIGATTAGYAVAIPVAVYVLAVWLVQRRHRWSSLRQRIGAPVVAALVLLTPLTPVPVLACGLLVAVLVAATCIGRAARAHPATPDHEVPGPDQPSADPAGPAT